MKIWWHFTAVDSYNHEIKLPQILAPHNLHPEICHITKFWKLATRYMYVNDYAQGCC